MAKAKSVAPTPAPAAPVVPAPETVVAPAPTPEPTPAPEPVVEESSSAKQRKADFQKIIDAYKVSNPVKYELKKDEFARKLAALK